MQVVCFRGYFGLNGIKAEVTPEDVARGFFFIDCPECGGTGEWNYYPDGYWEDTRGKGYIPTSEDLMCVECKGTGKQIVNL